VAAATAATPVFDEMGFKNFFALRAIIFWDITLFSPHQFQIASGATVYWYR